MENFGEEGWSDESQERPSKEKKKSDGKTGNITKSQEPRPRLSSQLTNTLNVLKSGVDRLMSERSQLDTVRKNIRFAEADVEKEIARIERMMEINQQALDFQQGKSSEDNLRMSNAGGRALSIQGEAAPGTSTSSGIAGASGLSGLRAVTDKLLVELGSEGHDATSDDNSDNALQYLNNMMEGLGIGANVFAETDAQEQLMQELKNVNRDEKEKEG